MKRQHEDDLWIVEFWSPYHEKWLHLFDREHRAPHPLESALKRLKEEQVNRRDRRGFGPLRIRNIHSAEVIMGAIVL